MDEHENTQADAHTFTSIGWQAALLVRRLNKKRLDAEASTAEGPWAREDKPTGETKLTVVAAAPAKR